MSQGFSFPPPPPPPPQRRDPPPVTDNRGGFAGRGRSNTRSHYSAGGPNRGRGSHNSYNSHRGRGDFSHKAVHLTPKRDFSTAFATQPQTRPRAPPAVPSFDVDIKSLLLTKTPAVSGNFKERRSNILGLTPSGQEASESEDEPDDEAQLANSLNNTGLQFEHRGQKLALRTPEEIAAWVAERRKRYPTQAKVESAKREAEEKRKEWEERKRLRDETYQIAQETRKREQNDKERRRLKDRAIAVQIAKAKSAVADSKDDPTLKARQRAEKLRKRAEKATNELKMLEEQIQRPEQQPRVSESMDIQNVGEDLISGGTTDSSSNSDLDDTSSSGSSGEDSDDNSEPEVSTSKQPAPESAASFQRETGKGNSDGLSLCKNMVRFGRCKFGKKCRFSHRVNKDKTAAKSLPQSGRRKGLYQIMVDKERDDELRHALSVIIKLGDTGVLNEPTNAMSDTQNLKDSISSDTPT